MAIDIPRQRYSGNVKELTLGAGRDAVTVGGETTFPFYTFEGLMPNPPRIAIQVLDYVPEDWADACKEPYAEVLHDPVAWALKAQDVYKADMIQLWLKSTDPNGLNRGADEAAGIAKAVADAVSIPLIIWGCLNAEKDAEVLKKVAEACTGKDIIIGPVQEENHKQLGAMALAYGVTLVANTPIDINLAKQLNILLSNVGVPIKKIIIDPTTGGLGYGLEYTYSVMERIRQAAITQNDDKLQCPFFCNLADEVWKTKEAKQPTDKLMGDAAKRGILMEAVTAATLLQAGADILVMRHPDAIRMIRRYSALLGGFIMPEEAAGSEAEKPAQGSLKASHAPAESRIADSLKEGSLCKIVQIMDMPVELAPGYAMALIKSIEPDEKAEGIILSTRHEPAKPASSEQEEACEKKTAREIRKAEFLPSDTWAPLEDAGADYQYQLEEKKDFSGKKVEVIAGSFESGKPEEKHAWRDKLDNQDEMLKQVREDLRYWYSEGHGSEKRKKPV